MRIFYTEADRFTAGHALHMLAPIDALVDGFDRIFIQAIDSEGKNSLG